MEQLCEIAPACSLAAFLGRAELLQMQVADTGLVEPGGELPLGEAGAARGRDGARIDDESHAMALEFANDVGRGRLLVADREKGRHGPHMVSAGVRGSVLPFSPGSF